MLFIYFFLTYSFFIFVSQFKVLRGGCWQKINFARAGDLQLKKAEGSRILSANPWIRHFRTGGKPQVVAPADVQNNVASTSEALGLVGNHATCNSKHIHASHFHLCHHDLVGSDTGNFSLFCWQELYLDSHALFHAFLVK